MVERYQGIKKIQSRFRPSKEKLVVKLKAGEFNLGTLLTLERFAWTQGKTISVIRDGKEFTIPELRKELEDGA